MNQSDINNIYNNDQIDEELSKYNIYSKLGDLYGANLEQKRQIQRDSNIINIGRGLGALVGGIGGYIFGSEFASSSPHHNYSISPGNVAGSILGALAGGSLGNYLTFKAMAKTRDNVDDDFGFRHFRKPAQLAALQGLSKRDQSRWNQYGFAADVSDTFGAEIARKIVDQNILNELIEAGNTANRNVYYGGY